MLNNLVFAKNIRYLPLKNDEMMSESIQKAGARWSMGMLIRKNAGAGGQGKVVYHCQVTEDMRVIGLINHDCGETHLLSQTISTLIPYLRKQ